MRLPTASGGYTTKNLTACTATHSGAHSPAGALYVAGMKREFDPRDIRQRQQADEAAELARRLARENQAADIKWLMDHPQGRRLVWDLLGFTGIYRQVFTGNSETFFNDGKRVVGLRYLDLVNRHAPEQYTTMLKEHVNDN